MSKAERQNRRAGRDTARIMWVFHQVQDSQSMKVVEQNRKVEKNQYEILWTFDCHKMKQGRIAEDNCSRNSRQTGTENLGQEQRELITTQNAGSQAPKPSERSLLPQKAVSSIIKTKSPESRPREGKILIILSKHVYLPVSQIEIKLQ